MIVTKQKTRFTSHKISTLKLGAPSLHWN